MHEISHGDVKRLGGNQAEQSVTRKFCMHAFAHMYNAHWNNDDTMGGVWWGAAERIQ